MPSFGKKKKKDADLDSGFGDMESSEEESGSGSDEESSDDDAPIYKVEDEPGQEELDPPVKYQARKKAKIRLKSAVDSDEVGTIAVDQFIMVTHTMDVDGQLRLRFNKGWTSLKTAKGYQLMMTRGDATYYKTTKKDVKVRKEADPESEVVGTIDKGSIFEVLETQEPDPSSDFWAGHKPKKSKLVKMHEGWVITHAVEPKKLAGEIVGIDEKKQMDVEKFNDPEGDKKLAAEAAAAAKQAKVDAKAGKKADKAAAKKEAADLKAMQAQLNTDIKSVAAFEKQLTSLLASMPELCVEGCAADIEKCKKTAAAKKKELSDKLKASGGSQDAEEGEPPEPEAEPEPEK